MSWLLVALMGCDGVVGGEGGEAPACELALEALEGKTFLMLEAMPDQTSRKNALARVRFDREGEQTVAKYTVASLSDVYDLPCEMRTKGEDSTLFCAEESRPQDWCQALLVADESCSKRVLKDLGATQSDDELNEAIKAAKENVKKYKADPGSWKRFQLNNNNLGNKLQGRLYVELDERRCRLIVGDYYWTLYNGKGLEDTNPVGTNPFVEDDGEWLFEHCTEGNIMPGIATETLPEDLSTIPGRGRKYAKGTPTWFHYLGDKHIKAEEGCTYDYDLWSQWKRVSKGNVVSPDEDGALVWKVQHTFDAGVTMMGAPTEVGVLTVIRNKTCAGKRETLDVVCEAGLLH